MENSFHFHSDLFHKDACRDANSIGLFKIDKNESKYKIIRECGNSKVLLVENGGYKLVRKQIEFTEGRDEMIKKVNRLKEYVDRNTLIVKDYETDESERKYYVYTEYIQNGNLKEKIKEKSEQNGDFLKQVLLFQIIISRK